MTVFLCGFMGCGKSIVGKLAAKKLGCGFCDTDDLIVRIEDMTIPEIFEKKGEAHVRAAEAAIVKSLCGKKTVAACGGGAMLNPDTAKAARSSGSAVVFLDVPFAECYERIKDDTNRPLVVNNTREQLEEIYNARRSVYKAHATVVIDACGSPVETADQIAAAVRR